MKSSHLPKRSWLSMASPTLVEWTALGLEQARHPLVEVVLVGMPAALVDQREVAAALDPGQSDAALCGDHLFRGVGVDPPRDVPVVAVGAPQPFKDAVLLRGEAGLERAVDVLADRERLAGAGVGARRGGLGYVPEQRSSVGGGRGCGATGSSTAAAR